MLALCYAFMCVVNVLVISLVCYPPQHSLTNDARFVGNSREIEDE